MGGITEIATSAPGYSSVRPNSMAPLPEILRLNGYSTAQFGKCHEVPVWEASPVGPFDRWPTGSGFEHFYGFIAGETNQWYPSIHEGTKVVDPPKTPEEGYHFMEDMTDRAIAWVRQQQAPRWQISHSSCILPLAPRTHPTTCQRSGPTNTRANSIRAGTSFGKRRLARQKKLGVVPQDCELTDATKRDSCMGLVIRRSLNAYSRARWKSTPASLTFADHHIGRLIDALEQIEALDNTLIYYIIGDNGASGEGTPARHIQ